MQPEIRLALDRLLKQQPLDGPTLRQAIGAIMDGRCGPVETAALLTALAVKGETEEELAGAAAAMRERAIPIESGQSRVLDTCGTGGDNLHTFNISTAAALVAASAGVTVAKHGNRSVSSSSGSADVLEALGVNIEISPQQAGQCLDEVGICFCFARTFHHAMKQVAPVRAELGFRTIFNLLGPLTNPARADYQLLGASRNHIAQKLAGALARLGITRGLVVCGNDQLDEVSLWGHTNVWDVEGTTIQHYRWNAADFGLPECTSEELRVSSAAESADVIRQVFAGRPGPARDITLANAAAALVCRGDAPAPLQGVNMAAQAIDDGKTLQLLERLVDWTNHRQCP